MTPGIYTSMPFDKYLEIPAMSASALKAGCRSMLRMRHAFETTKEATPEMVFGSLADCLLFEPDVFASRFHVIPERPDRRTKAGKAAWEQAETDAAGREIVTAADVEQAKAAIAATMEHEDAGKLLRTPGLVQLTAVWADPATGVLCKMRADRVIPGKIGIDVKTTTDIAPWAFARRADSLGYHIQLAWYRRGLAACGKGDTPFVLVAVEKEAPHDVAVYELPDGVMDAATETIDRLLAAFVKCRTSGKWPGQVPKVQVLEMPSRSYIAGGPACDAEVDDHPFE